MGRRTWGALARGGCDLVVAVDTEFEGAETLTAQFAVRDGDTVRVQVYYSPTIPAPRPRWFAGLGRRFPGRAGRVVVRPAKRLTPDQSPARVVADLLGVTQAEYLDRIAGRAAAVGEGRARERAGRVGGIDAGAISVQLVGHFLRADFLRAFGAAFWRGLLVGGAPEVEVRDTKVIGLAGPGAERFAAPVVEYVRAGGRTVPLALGTFDTCAAVGGGSLDAVAGSILGVGKVDALGDEHKARMRDLFWADPERAYRYCV